MEETRRINWITGILGALVGTMIGMALYIAIYQFGFIAGIAGVVMMVCSIRGFELLGHGLNIPSVIFCIVLVLVAVYVSNRLAMAVEIMLEWEYDLPTSLTQLDRLIAGNSGVAEAYLKNLGMGYVLTIFAIVPSVRNLIRGRRQ